MSSSTNIDSFQFAIRQTNIYGGLFVFIAGVFGELLNIIIFTTLKTFRETTCAFYLIMTSIANVGVIVIILLRVIYDGFDINLHYTPLLCKFRYSLSEYGNLISTSSMCLATIDQFLSMTKYKQWSSSRIAHRLTAFACIFWFVYEIFIFIYYDSNLNACIITNGNFAKYYTYFHLPFIFGFFPLTIMIIFSILAFIKIRTIASRQINVVRLSRDRQLTTMTLFHVLNTVITGIPFVVFLVYTLLITTTDPVDIARNRLIFTIILFFYYINFSCSFYIYCCVSKRFRKQVTYVLVDILLNRRRHRINNNQIMPYTIEMAERHNRITTTASDDIALY